MKILRIEFCDECNHKRPYDNHWVCVWGDKIIGQLFEAMQTWCPLPDEEVKDESKRNNIQNNK